MNKPLPAPPKEDDLVSTFDALKLAGEKPPVAASKKDSLVSHFNALNLVGKKRPTATYKENGLVRNFNILTLGGKKPSAPDQKLPDALLPSGRPASQHTFVGGFNPGLLALDIEPHPQSRQPANQHAKTATPPSRTKEPTELPRKLIPMPIPMPVPPAAKQSLTMQYALQPTRLDIPAKRTLAPAPATPPLQSDSDSIPSPKETSRPRLPDVVSCLVKPAHPVTPNRQRSASVPPSLVTPSPGKAQCNAQTKIGKQCSRKVNLPATHSHLDPTPALYCFQHKDKIIDTPGFYVRKARMQGKFVEFSHYIPKYLQIDTQLALKVEMEKTTAAADKPGYIYTFEIRDPERPDVIQLKVGRAVNLAKRLDQWDKQCGSKVNIPRGWWPGTVEDDDGSLLKGNIRSGDPGPFCHRVERLVHIELADLSLHAPYLDPSWPNNIVSDHRSPSASARSRPRATTCVDCGAVHKEIFTFRRPENGSYKGNEWDLIVKPVIEKWGKFVKEHYA